MPNQRRKALWCSSGLLEIHSVPSPRIAEKIQMLARSSQPDSDININFLEENIQNCLMILHDHSKVTGDLTCIEVITTYPSAVAQVLPKSLI